MKITAGLGAAKGELARFIGNKFDFRDFVPIGLKLAVVIFPGILKIGPSFANYKFDRVSIQQKSMGSVQGGRL